MLVNKITNISQNENEFIITMNKDGQIKRFVILGVVMAEIVLKETSFSELTIKEIKNGTLKNLLEQTLDFWDFYEIYEYHKISELLIEDSFYKIKILYWPKDGCKWM